MQFNRKTYTPLECLSSDRPSIRSNGYYKPVPHGIELYTLEGKLTALLHSGGYVLEARVHRGKTRYLMGATTETREWLGLSPLSKHHDSQLVGFAIAQLPAVAAA